jgi:hypothetical protein
MLSERFMERYLESVTIAKHKHGSTVRKPFIGCQDFPEADFLPTLRVTY